MAKKYTLDQLTDAIGNIDDRYVADARSELTAAESNETGTSRAGRTRRRINSRALTAAAAVLVLAVTAVLLIPRFIKKGASNSVQSGYYTDAETTMTNHYPAPSAPEYEDLKLPDEQVAMNLYYWFTESGCRFALIPAEIDDETEAFESGYYEDQAIQNSMDLDDLKKLMEDPESADYIKKNIISVISLKKLAGGRKSYNYIEKAAENQPDSGHGDDLQDQIDEVKALLGMK